MNIGSQRHFSYGCRRLSRSVLCDQRSRPLLFLYPSWFRREWSRNQHIAHALGQDEESSGVNGSSKENKKGIGPRITRYEPRTQFKTPTMLIEKNSQRATRQQYSQQDDDAASVLNRQGLPVSSPPADLEYANEDTIRKITTSSSSARATGNADAKSEKHIRYMYKKINHDPAGLNATMLADALLWASANAAEINENEIESVNVSKNLLMKLAGSTKENMWIHSDGSKCAVIVTQDIDKTSKYQTILLRGSLRSREITRKYLEKSESTSVDSSLDYTKRTSSIINRVGHLHQVPEPTSWNVRTFYEYIKIVTSFWPRRSVSRYLYRDTSYNQEIGRLLKSLFSRPDLIHCISAKALQRTLRFCRTYSDVSHVASYVLKQAIEHGIQPDLSTYNEEIGRMLSMNNELGVFQQIRKMSSTGFRPNARSWSLVLSYIESGSVRRRILDEVKAQGLLDQLDDKQVIARIFVGKEFPFYMAKPNGVEAFFKEMDSQFDHGWLGCQTIRAMLRACRRGGGQSMAASQVLAKSQDDKHKVELDALCMIELLHISLNTGNMRDAAEILKSAPFRRNRSHDQKIVETAQKLAWKKRFYNISRLLWHYAASAGIITHEISTMVKKSLVWNVCSPHPANSFLEVWDRTAGKIIVGTNLDSTNFDKIFPFLHKAEVNSKPIDWFKKYAPNDGTRNDQMMLAHLIIERDLNAWRFFKRMSWDRFLSLLDEALNLDLAWKEQKVIEERSVDWMVDNVMKVALTPRKKPLILDSDTSRKWFIVNDHKLDMNTLRLSGDQEQQTRPAVSKLEQVSHESEADVDWQKYPDPDSHIHLSELAQIAAVVNPSKFHQQSLEGEGASPRKSSIEDRGVM